MNRVSAFCLILSGIGVVAAGNASTVEGVADSAAESIGIDPATEAVERALPWLEEEGTWWMEEKKCVSCHHSTFFVWAKDLAREAGLAVDAGVLDEQRRWVWEEMLSPREDANGDDGTVEEETPPEPKRKGDLNVEGVSQLLLSASSDRVPEETKISLAEMIRFNRKDDGSWSAGGQLPRQKRPAEETREISKQWALAALSVVDDAPRETPDPIAAKTTEWFALDALLRDDAESLAALVSRQNDDGGWSWIDGEESDPTATGQALFALGRSGAGGDHDAARERGRAYLVSTQEENGSWDTRSTKDREKSTRVSDFWGTTWAVIGLLESRE